MPRRASERRSRRMRVMGKAIEATILACPATRAAQIRSPAWDTMKVRMPTLRHTSARALEFDAFLELLRGYTQSPLGRARVEALAPTSDREWAEQQQRLAQEIG